MNIRTLNVLCLSLLLVGCVSGVTGYSGLSLSERDSQPEYRFDHPGLAIRIRVPATGNLMEPTSVGNDKRSAFLHTIQYGDTSNPTTLLIAGRFAKRVQLNDACYPSVRRGTLLVVGSEVSINGQPLDSQPCP